MHHQGNLLGPGAVWGYVEGGMGRVSFAIAAGGAGGRRRRSPRACPWRGSSPGEGVELESGELIRARRWSRNADPKRTLAMLDGAERPGRAIGERLEGWRSRSPVVKLNAALRRLPELHRRRRASSPTGRWSRSPRASTRCQEAFEACERGEPRDRLRRALLPDRLRPERSRRRAST